jgi:hypothetical protein
LYEKKAGISFLPSIEIISSLFLESRPGDLDTFHSLGRHGATGAASCTVGMLLAEVGSGDDVIAFPPAGHAKFVVLVTLP